MLKAAIYILHILLRKLLQVSITLVTAIILSILLIIFALRTGEVKLTPLMLIEQQKNKTIWRQKWVRLENISEHLIRAVIATEDNNFFYHAGIDIEAVKWALQKNKAQSKKIYGASTLSQQTAKNAFLPHTRTWWRKGIELIFTLLIETIWSKARIMEVYLNIIELGKNIYGIEAAAKYYFNKSAQQLTQNEATLIAIAIPNPKQFNPAKPTPYMLNRQTQVYEVMNKTFHQGWYKNIKNIKRIKVNYLEE
ncbi:MAG: monofunctional biosynthetic peptidoglycan transglycosylase [Bacteroidales bacterium]